MANFCARIAESAARFGGLPAIELAHADGQTTSITYSDLLMEAGCIAGWLQGTAGLSTGDRAAILADNDARWIAAYLGTMWMGGVAVPLDTAYKPAQVATIAENSGARVLFTTPKYLETARAAVALMGVTAPRIQLLGDTAPETAPPMAGRADQDAAVILYTSGTTADPKGVVLTHANLDAERLSALSVVQATERDAVLGVLPLFHALAQMANLLLPLSVGARVVFLESVNSTSLLAALETRGISIFACVPQFFYLIHQRVTTEVAKGGRVSRRVFRTLISTNVWLRDHLGWNPGRIVFAKVHRALGPKMRILVTGGSRFDPAIGRDLYGMGLTLLNGYGLTETSGAATIQRPEDKFTTSVGPALPGVEIRIGFDLGGRNALDVPVDPRGRHESTGEILLRGPVIMREYFNRPDATAEALRDGWLHTGDLGRLDEQGRLYITGRLKEIIVLASGKNLYPEEIEAHYKQCVFIKELCVLGLARPGEPAAERLHAVIVPNDDALRERGTVNVRDLLRFEIETLSVQLPAHKRILSYDIALEPLPRTTTGKLKRPEIERRAQERAASAARTDSRPLTDAEREWLMRTGHAAALNAITARTDRPNARPDANLELDLGLDSMERVELLTFLEQRAGTRVSPAVRATIFTVRHLVDAVEAAPRVESSDAAATTETSGPADDAWEALLALPPDPALAANLKKPKPLRAAAFYVALRLSRVAARVLLRFKSSGLEHVPSQGPFLLCPNHQTSIDPLFLVAVLPFRTLRQFYAVGAAEYFQTPFTAWFARAVNVVPVDPDANLINAMQAGATGLRMGKVLVLFPEGERSIDGEIKTFRRGAAILSGQLQAPIVPIALDGLYDLWPRGRKFAWRQLLPWRSRPVTIRIGPPMQVTRGAYHAGTTTLQQTVAGLLAEIRAERPATPSR